MDTLHSVQRELFGVKAVFKIELKNSKNVYMSTARTNCMNGERCIVIVDSEKFLELWRNEPYSIHSDISMGGPETWTNDRKYPHAEKGFSFGISNPVPLATIVCSSHIERKAIYERRYFVLKRMVGVDEQQLDYVSFINGITRTIWLLSHGAKYFPVECGIKDGAEKLSKIAGHGKNNFATVEQLTANT